MSIRGNAAQRKHSPLALSLWGLCVFSLKRDLIRVKRDLTLSTNTNPLP